MTVNAAAWVPYDSRDWNAVAADAVDWVEARCAEDGASGVLVQPTLDDRHVRPLTRCGQRHAVTSRRAGRDRVGPGRGPVLVYVPDADDLDFAMRLARESAIAAVRRGFVLPTGFEPAPPA